MAVSTSMNARTTHVAAVPTVSIPRAATRANVRAAPRAIHTVSAAPALPWPSKSAPRTTTVRTTSPVYKEAVSILAMTCPADLMPTASPTSTLPGAAASSASPKARTTNVFHVSFSLYRHILLFFLSFYYYFL